MHRPRFTNWATVKFFEVCILLDYRNRFRDMNLPVVANTEQTFVKRPVMTLAQCKAVSGVVRPHQGARDDVGCVDLDQAGWRLQRLLAHRADPFVLLKNNLPERD